MSWAFFILSFTAHHTKRCAFQRAIGLSSSVGQSNLDKCHMVMWLYKKKYYIKNDVGPEDKNHTGKDNLGVEKGAN